MKAPAPSRRTFLTGAAGALTATSTARAAAPHHSGEPFWGRHQAGIVTSPQTSTNFAAFDLRATKRQEVAALMRIWTQAAAGMTADQAQRLTITFGFGPGLFVKDGRDRYGLAPLRPEALIDLPRFNGDQFIAERTGGDLSVQACADDPQSAFLAIRHLSLLADGIAAIRWCQAGFIEAAPAGQTPVRQTPRNLMGFKDGTMNPLASDPALMDRLVWAGAESARWMKGGSYLVVRQIRIALDHWDRMKPAFQEQTMGRRKNSGAALGKAHEFDAIDLDAKDRDGNPVIAENAHIRMAAPAKNGGAQILRRSYSYDNGISMITERWPPWRQSLQPDVGLLFLCYQRDPRSGFVRIFENMARFDMLNQFVTHIGGGLFACPGGASPGGYIGQTLLDEA